MNSPLSDEIINRIAEQCTFQGIKRNEISYKIMDEEQSSPLLRKGVVGGWKNYFTPELNESINHDERFEKDVLEKLEGTGLEFDFEI